MAITTLHYSKIYKLSIVQPIFRKENHNLPLQREALRRKTDLYLRLLLFWDHLQIQNLGQAHLGQETASFSHIQLHCCLLRWLVFQFLYSLRLINFSCFLIIIIIVLGDLTSHRRHLLTNLPSSGSCLWSTSLSND